MRLRHVLGLAAVGAVHTASGTAAAEEPFERTRPFVGALLASGPSTSTIGQGVWSSTWGMLAALKGGLLVGRTELGLEIAPMSYLLVFSEPSFEVSASVGRHLRVGERVSWPLRAGLGIITIDTLSLASGQIGYEVWLHGRLDLVGLSFLTERALIDIHMPSFRISSSFDGGALLTWMFGVGVAVLPD